MVILRSHWLLCIRGWWPPRTPHSSKPITEAPQDRWLLFPVGFQFLATLEVLLCASSFSDHSRDSSSPLNSWFLWFVLCNFPSSSDGSGPMEDGGKGSILLVLPSWAGHGVGRVSLWLLSIGAAFQNHTEKSPYCLQLSKTLNIAPLQNFSLGCVNTWYAGQTQLPMCGLTIGTRLCRWMLKSLASGLR